MKAIITLISSFLSIALFAQEPAITLRLMGDSTMADKNLENGNPERGWGQMLKTYVDSSVLVVNYAKNGRSTKDFQTLGYWDTVMSDLKEGDYLFIQFGHNDAKSHDPQRYAAAFGEYQDNLKLFIDYALKVGAKPILFTPVSRRHFDETGKSIIPSHDEYPTAIIQVATEYGLPLIDATKITEEWLNSIGDEESRARYREALVEYFSQYEEQLKMKQKVKDYRTLYMGDDGELHTASRGAMNYDGAMVEILLHPTLIKIFKENPDIKKEKSMFSGSEITLLIQSLIWLLAGVGIFIVGMNFMGDALEKSAGSGMKRLLEKISNNRFSGVGIGAGVTAIIQSSSATSVMVIGLVNAGVMTLKQATPIIMGANIGTTITGVLVALKNDYFNMAMCLLAFAGVMTLFCRKSGKRQKILTEAVLCPS